MSANGPPVYRMKGPSALGGDRRRFFNLATTLALSEYRLRFFGSILGYAWSLARPLMLFGILYFVFSEVLDVAEGVRFYGVILLMGMLLYLYFAEATGGSVTSVVERENLVRKIQFPRMIIPLSVVLTATLNLVANFIALFIFMAAAGVDIRWTWLELPVLVAILFVFSMGISMLVSALFVPFRDMRPIWEVVLQALFYATPVLYPIELLAREYETVAKVVMCNPLAAVIQQARYALIDPQAQSAGAALGDPTLLLIPGAIVVLTFALGFWVFNHMAPSVAEDL